MTSEQLRWLWTLVGGVGVIAGLVALVVLVWLTNDARRYEWAIKQIHRPGLELATVLADGDVRDMWMLLGATGVLFLAVSAACGAGLAAIFSLSVTALALLVGTEVLLVAGLVMLVALAFMKFHRRTAIRMSVRLNRQAR